MELLENNFSSLSPGLSEFLPLMTVRSYSNPLNPSDLLFYLQQVSYNASHSMSIHSIQYIVYFLYILLQLFFVIYILVGKYIHITKQVDKTAHEYDNFYEGNKWGHMTEEIRMA